MKAIFCLMIWALIAPWAQAQTNLSELLQQGLFEEQANRNLSAAITDYEEVSTQFDKDRQLAATAIFRLGECYREEGLTNQAAAEYRRILNEFQDQKPLVTLSQEDLAGMGAAVSLPGVTTGSSATPSTSGNPTEAALLASRISGIESLTNTVEKARAVLAIFPENSADLQKMLMHLPMLQEQKAWLEAHPQTSSGEFNRTKRFAFAIGDGEELPTGDFVGDFFRRVQLQNTNLLASARLELQRELTYIQQQVDFILGLQQARLEALQAAAGSQNTPETVQAPAPSDDEDQEIARIQEMIQNSPDLINAPDDHGHTPLETAAINGWLKVAAFLLDHGADVNAGKYSALNLAANAGNRAMVEFLLSHGADINTKAWTGKTPLDTAASEGYQAVTEALLANKADVNAQDDFGDTPLLEAARNGHPEIVQMLLNAGANPNTTDKGSRTPLSFAANSDSLEVVKALLAAKADPNAGTMDAPLLCAIDKQDLVSAELLLQAGANPNANGLMHCPQGSYGSRWYHEYFAILRSATPLWLAIQNHQLPMVQLLLKYKANPDDSQTAEPPSAIFWAISDTNILQALLDAGANPNATDNVGNLPLTIAVSKDSPSSVEILLKHGADPNARDHDGATALNAAVYSLDGQIFRLLLDYGANPNVRDRDGQTPLRILEDVASGSMVLGGNIQSGQQPAIAASLADLLRRHGALEVLPDWDHITVSRPSSKYSAPIFAKGTNDWNQFTLLEFIYHVWQQTPLAFDDFAHITIVRPNPAGGPSRQIPVNLLNSTNGIDCSEDMPLEFGDIVNIPEREHTLAERDMQTYKEAQAIQRFLKQKAGTAKLVVDGGQTIELPLGQFEPDNCYLGNILESQISQSVLTSDSDLSRVNITRRDPKTGKSETWTIDHSAYGYGPTDLWVRSGDVIEVPEAK